MSAGQAGPAPAAATGAAAPPPSETTDMAPEIRERLNRLRDEVQATLHEEFDTTATDLEQLRGLLSDAAGKLAGAFCEMTQATAAFLKLLEDHPEVPGESPLRDAAVIAREMSSKTGTTVQSLQFEDMAAQLLQHVNRRLTAIEAFSKDMAVLSPDSRGRMFPLTSEKMDSLFDLLQQHRTDLSSVGRKTVQQQSLESGEIDLF